jgi:hypothetical protein
MADTDQSGVYGCEECAGGYIDTGPGVVRCPTCLERAIEQAITDLVGVAADSTPEAQAFVRDTAVPRLRAVLR